MKLEKKTHHLKSISLSLEEFDSFKKGGYTSLEVSGPTGKHIKTFKLNPPLCQKFIKNSILLPTDHKDENGETRLPGDQAWYWVMNCFK